MSLVTINQIPLAKEVCTSKPNSNEVKSVFLTWEMERNRQYMLNKAKNPPKLFLFQEHFCQFFWQHFPGFQSSLSPNFICFSHSFLTCFLWLYFSLLNNSSTHLFSENQISSWTTFLATLTGLMLLVGFWTRSGWTLLHPTPPVCSKRCAWDTTRSSSFESAKSPW